MKTEQNQKTIKNSRRPFEENNIRVDSIEEDENKTWEGVFLYDELEITDDVYRESHCVRRRECFSSSSKNAPRTLLLRH